MRFVQVTGPFSFDVEATNTGNTKGKDVIEAYHSPLYTNGGNEEASVNLIAFPKTDLLEPRQSQTLTLEFSVEDMAFYDVCIHGYNSQSC